MKIANVSAQNNNPSPAFGKVYNTLTACALVAEKAKDPAFKKAYMEFDKASKDLFEINEYGEGIAIRGIDTETRGYTDFFVKNDQSATAALITATKKLAKPDEEDKPVRQRFPGNNSASDDQDRKIDAQA